MAGIPSARPKGRRMDTEGAVDGIVGSAYELHRAGLLRYVGRITRDAMVAEDLVQDAFLRLTVETAAGRAPDDIGPWLYRVSHNLAMSRGRRLSVADRKSSSLAFPDQPASPESVALAHERDREIGAMVAELDPVHQAALALAAMGYGGDEIARSIGRSNPATRSLLCRARAKVRMRLLSTQPIAP
jgi:RNA polymerase sigma factor (sigma-70 family)